MYCSDWSAAYADAIDFTFNLEKQSETEKRAAVFVNVVLDLFVCFFSLFSYVNAWSSIILSIYIYKYGLFSHQKSQSFAI